MLNLALQGMLHNAELAATAAEIMPLNSPEALSAAQAAQASLAMADSAVAEAEASVRMEATERELLIGV